MVGDPAYKQAIGEIYMRAAKENLDAAMIERMEFAVAIQFRLGTDFPNEKKEKIWSIQQEARMKHATLVEAAMNGKHTRESFCEALYDLMCETPRRTQEILSPDEYEKYWGMKPGESPTREKLGIFPSLINWITDH